MGIADLTDQSILHFYDNICSQVEAERGLPHKLMTSDAVKQRATALREEITRRRLQRAPIEWPRE